MTRGAQYANDGLAWGWWALIFGMCLASMVVGTLGLLRQRNRRKKKG
jgi:formate hydrogenlyase subunit 3/multisubunit Na+/H+ antiporter MnhD subunit